MLRVGERCHIQACLYLSLNTICMMFLTMGRSSTLGVLMVGMVFTGFRTGGTIFGTKRDYVGKIGMVIGYGVTGRGWSWRLLGEF